MLTTAAMLLTFSTPTIAGVDNPLKWDGVHIIDRCPKLTNPIECGAFRQNNDKGSDDEAPVRAIPSSTRVGDCTELRDRYIFHHWDEKPASLRGYSGCVLYRKDAKVHARLVVLGLKDYRRQEAFESLLSVAVIIEGWFDNGN